MKHDPKEYNPKIARLEGYYQADQFNMRDNPDVPCLVWHDPEGRYCYGELPQYHESPADLLRALLTIGEKIRPYCATIPINQRATLSSIRYEVVIDRSSSWGDTFEQAAYSAVCQWIDREANRSEKPNSSGGILKDYNDPAKGYREEGGGT